MGPEDVRRLDATYARFPSFSEWSGLTVARRLWDEALALVAERRAGATEGDFGEMVERALRAAAVDTGAIEGLYTVDRGYTVSVLDAASAWQAEVAETKGPDVAALIGAQRRAYELALDAATGYFPITEALIRRFHEEVCAAQGMYPVRTPVGPQHHPLIAGEYKRHPNHVEKADGSTHAYAPVGDTPAEMHRLVEELRSQAFTESHPVLQAAYVHYSLAAVHPFADGNGRVARLLASVYLLRSTSLPLMIWADQKASYLRSLAAADAGQPQAFVDFVLERAVDLQLEVADRLLDPEVPHLGIAVGRLRNALTTVYEDLTHAELELIAFHILEEVNSVLRLEFGRLDLPPGVEVQEYWPRDMSKSVPGFRAPQGRPITEFRLEVSAPASQVSITPQVLIATGRQPSFAFRLQPLGMADALLLRISEVHPAITEAARLRIERWADRVLRISLEELALRITEPDRE